MLSKCLVFLFTIGIVFHMLFFQLECILMVISLFYLMAEHVKRDWEARVSGAMMQPQDCLRTHV